MSGYLLVSRSTDFETRLESLLGPSLGTSSADQFRLAAGSVPGLTSSRPSVAVLGPLLSYEETRSLSMDLTARYPGLGILVVHSGASELEDWVDDMVIHAVIDPEADDAAVRHVVERLEEMNPPIDEVEPDVVADVAADVAAEQVPPPEIVPAAFDADRRQLIAVLAPKGGQGKTTLAVNIAAGLAETAPNSVVLVDADLQFGDIANALDMSAARTVVELVDASAVDEMALKTSLPRHADNFFVVPAPRSPEEADRVSAAGLAKLLDALAEIFSYVVVDTAPGLDENTLTVIERATVGVFVSNMSVPALRAMNSELDVLGNAGLLPTRRRHVLNFCDHSGGITAKDAAHIVGVDFDAVLPRSHAVLLASNLGLPLIRRESRDPVSKAIRSLVAGFEPSVLPSPRHVPRRRSS